MRPARLDRRRRDRLLPRALRRRARPVARPVRAAAGAGAHHRPRQRRHEGRPSVDALRRARARDLGTLQRKIVFHFVPDEETGSTVGSGHLRDKGLIDPDAIAMLPAEPTGGVVWHASRGAITLRVTTRGREAHVGQVQLGDNAFERMLRTAAPLVALSHELLAHDSMLVVGGAAGAGANFNVVLGSAWFSVDRRFNPEEDLETEVQRLLELLDGAEVEVLQRQPSAVTDAAHPRALELARCVAAVEGAPPAFALCPGVLETRWYAPLCCNSPAFSGDPVSHM